MLANRDPFTQEALNKIFEISSKHSDRLVSRESNGLEFKESFGFGSLSRYIRTAAGFANAKGGYIVYGIGNSPHILIGLQGDAFNKFDPDKLTHYLNEHFDPVMHWEQHLYELKGKTFGLLYFHESGNKPVICKKSDSLQKYGSRSSDYMVTSDRLNRFSGDKASSLIISHLKRIHSSFNEAGMQESQKVLEMAYGDPINQWVDRISKDSKLRSFWPNELFMDVEIAYGELVSYCEKQAEIDSLSTKQPLSLDRGVALNNGNKKGDAVLSLHDQIPSFSDGMINFRSQRFIANVSNKRLPPLHSVTIDAAVEIASELMEYGHDKDYFLNQLPLELSLIVRSRL